MTMTEPAVDMSDLSPPIGPAEGRRMLAVHHVGRLIWWREPDLQIVLSVYLLRNGHLHLGPLDRDQVADLTTGDMVFFEVDDWDTMGTWSWSVIVAARVGELTDEPLLSDGPAIGPTDDPSWLRLDIAEISGRRRQDPRPVPSLD